MEAQLSPPNSTTPATRFKQAREVYPHFPKNSHSPVDVIRSIIWWWMHHHTLKNIHINPEEWKINNQRDQKQEDRNVGSATGDTTTKKCGKQCSGKNFKTINCPVFTCTTFQYNYIKFPQVNQTRFPEDVDGHHIKPYQETPWKIKEYKNGTPAHEETSAKINLRKPP